MEDLIEPILINLVFDPMLKPELVGGKRAFACDGCVAWHHKNIHFLVPPRLRTLQDLAEVIKSDHGIQSNIILSTKGSVLPLVLPCKVLTMITGAVDVLPMRPIVKVVAPKCTCAVAAAEVFERMICQFGDSNTEELTQPPSNSAGTAEKSGTLQRAAGESHLDEIEMDERDFCKESSLSLSTSKGIDHGNTSDQAPMSIDDQQSTTLSALTSKSEGHGLTPGSSVCTFVNKVYDTEKEPTEKSTEDMEAVSMQSSQEKESPEEIYEEPNANETLFIPDQGQLASTETTGSSAWTTVTASSNENCEQLDEKQNETQAGTRSANLDDSSDNISCDAAVATGGVGLQDGAGAEMMETKEESSENLVTESFDMLDDSAPSTTSTSTTSSAKRPSFSLSAEEFGRVLKKPRMITDSVKQYSVLRSFILNNLEAGAPSGESFPFTSTPNSNVDFSAAYGGGEREATGASCSGIEKTEDSEMDTFTKFATKG